VTDSIFSNNGAQSSEASQPHGAVKAHASVGSVEMNLFTGEEEVEEPPALGEHIFLGSSSVHLFACSERSNNSFEDPVEQIGVAYSDGQSACV
jgi:hypothetical protein